VIICRNIPRRLRSGQPAVRYRAVFALMNGSRPVHQAYSRACAMARTSVHGIPRTMRRIIAVFISAQKYYTASRNSGYAGTPLE